MIPDFMIVIIFCSLPLGALVFFLLAVFQQGRGTGAPLGALLGVLCSVLAGWAFYRGSLRLNLKHFFRGTGLFILLVAAGLLSGAPNTCSLGSGS